jgi:hypothetical protein
MLTSVNQKDIDNWFIYHQPKSDQVDKYQVIRDVGKKVAIAIFNPQIEMEDFKNAVEELKETILRLCPESSERQYALFHCSFVYELFDIHGSHHTMERLRFQVIMPANAAITCNE